MHAHVPEVICGQFIKLYGHTDYYSIDACMVIFAAFDFKTRQYDVVNAFVNNNIDERNHQNERRNTSFGANASDTITISKKETQSVERFRGYPWKSNNRALLI